MKASHGLRRLGLIRFAHGENWSNNGNGNVSQPTIIRNFSGVRPKYFQIARSSNHVCSPLAGNKDVITTLTTKATFSSDAPQKKPEHWKIVKDKYLHMDIEEKRSEYYVKGNYLEPERIRLWPTYFRKKNLQKTKDRIKYPINYTINSRVSIGLGNMVALEFDAVVNSTTRDMTEMKGRLNKLIHQAAGPELLEECKSLRGCNVGEAIITGGYRLPAKYIIHTVGPAGHASPKLNSCYMSILGLVQQYQFQTVGIPCISTNSKGYPRKAAAHIALDAVRTFLEKHPVIPNLIVFVIHSEEDMAIYEDLMQVYFPLRD